MICPNLSLTMKTYQLKFLAWTFSAFLPPDDPSARQEADYYELLGVEKNASADEIKKAYRKRSLELHPDKLRQRGMRFQGEVVTEDEARHKFQQMKASYDTLSDPKKRKVYDALGYKGLEFIVNPSHAWDPHNLLGNLAKSSVFDRAKLMLLIMLFFGLVLMQPILICAKVDQVLEENGGALEETSWFAILIPFWIFALLFGLVMVIGKAFLALLQWISLVVGVVFFSLKFDNIVSWDYAIVFIPLYVWVILRALEANMEMKAVKEAMSKMVTIEYIEKYILNEKKQDENGNDIEGGFHRTYNDLSEEERDQINKDYIIVHVPPRQMDPGEQAENSIEHDLDQIERSPEYQEALSQHQSSFQKIQKIILPEIPLMILVILQLDLNKTWNWGLTFLPLWVSMFLECCGGCYGFFCTASLAHLEADEAMAAHLAKQKEAKEAAKDEEAKDSFENDAKPAADSEEKLNSVEPTAAESPTCIPLGSDAAKNDDADSFKKNEIDAAVAVAATNDATVETNKATKENKSNKVADAPGDDRQETSDGTQNDEPDMFTMDEEAFQFYQEAEQEAESKATEAQSKAIASFCNIIFQAIIASLFVAKLNEVYAERQDEIMDGTNSYSAFWILFPLLLVAGCTISCCACAIFCAADIDNVISSDENQDDTEVPSPQNDAEAAQTSVNSVPAGAEASESGKVSSDDNEKKKREVDAADIVKEEDITAEESLHDLD
mmetsp:Transcript_25069/g.52737  ORF Transcript_25069/g.52737 Transcript_25069/m.52737 type:complete len:723 (-) Transcript_25069:627-2795(-)